MYNFIMSHPKEMIHKPRHCVDDYLDEERSRLNAMLSSYCMTKRTELKLKTAKTTVEVLNEAYFIAKMICSSHLFSDNRWDEWAERYMRESMENDEYLVATMPTLVKCIVMCHHTLTDIDLLNRCLQPFRLSPADERLEKMVGQLGKYDPLLIDNIGEVDTGALVSMAFRHEGMGAVRAVNVNIGYVEHMDCSPMPFQLASN